MKLAPSMFQRYDWDSTREELAAQILTLDQECAIKNELVTISEQKITLAYNLDKPDEFRLTHEYMRGQLDILQYILAKSEAAKAELITLSQQV